MKLFLFIVHFVSNTIFYTGIAIMLLVTYYALFVEPSWYWIISVLVITLGVITEWWYTNCFGKAWSEL